MLHLHDVWVNWFENEENGYNVCHFHEWRKDDGIELLDQVPLLYITSELFNYIENDLSELPEELLKAVYKKAYVRKSRERRVLDYSCVVTDGNDCLVIDTIGYQIPIRKSRLIPRQEFLVYDMIKQSKMVDYGYNKSDFNRKYTLYSLHPKYMYGLTRRERNLKKILMMALDGMKDTNLSELKYWLTELYPSEYKEILEMDRDITWNKLEEGLLNGWSDTHEQLCPKLIRGQSYLEMLWKEEIEIAK